MQTRDAYNPSFAVVVLGAGPCGSAAAAGLARRGLPTALVGRPAGERPNVGECLPAGIQPQLEKAGVWDEFLRAGHTSSAGIRSVWGSPEAFDRDFLMSPYSVGWHIDRARFDEMMIRSASRNGAEAVECSAIRNVVKTASGWRIHLSTGSGERVLNGGVVIDATGRSSVFARRLGVKRILLDRLTGVAGYFTPRDGGPTIEPVLLLEAVEHGWWYTAPLPENRMIAVFLTDASHVQAEALTQPDCWLRSLHQTVHQRHRIEAHGGTLEAVIRILPAESSYLEQIAGDGWLAAGDAATAFDPLSSQGIISAISAGLDAAGTAAAWLAGDTKAPQAYAAVARRKYAEYLAHRQIYYGIERRWPDSRFWNARRVPPEALAAPRSGTNERAAATQ
ncbi:MAG: tryptophan 7-halogenase [Bryobacteraceae bacterium]|nr:tryptophan 7-halogenase [Bryobacteraceae bacterium]